MKYKLLYLILFTGLVLTGCSDNFLKEAQSYGKYDESIFANQTETGWFIDKMYYDYFYGFNSPIKTIVGLYSTDNTYCTEEKGGTITSLNQINGNQVTLTNAADGNAYYGATMTSTVTANPYTRIRNCNILISEMDDTGKGLPTTFRNTAKGQAYFLRALQYYDLVRIYGGVPIDTVVYIASTDASTQLPRATTTQCVTQIVSDLKMAASLLPTSWTASTDYGRFTKGAALAVISRVLLTYASPLFNNDWDNSSNQRWKDALAAGLAAKAECDADGYGLYGSSAKDWATMFAMSNTVNKEAIMVQLCNSSSASSSAVNNGWENTIRLTSQGGSGGLAAPKEMIDLFPLANGTRPTVSNGYVDSLFFLNRDPRFYRTFAFNGRVWGHKANSSRVVWSYRHLFYNTSKKSTSIVYTGNNTINSPAYVCKMSSSTADTTAIQYSGTQIYEYRYAELLLNIAECYAATGDLTNCLSYLKLIRARVGVPAGTLGDYGITNGAGSFADKYAAIEACLYERRIELAYEGKRFWDIQRWLLYSGSSTASTGSNTCSKLGLTPINGTCRTGNYWQTKTMISGTTDSDPLASVRGSISVNPDDATFQTELQNLATFYKTYLVRVKTESPMDSYSSGSQAYIKWNPNYYIWGLTSTILSNNTWLPQTIGWNDNSGTNGTFDYTK
ncbi:MAG: RagB/SusD family nutrient uptake outer membrane protein [Bacteroidetes bacterium]|nr:RagB/SusD family nutrient uptake outer membrane protein [Bacteroidota bacterium]